MYQYESIASWCSWCALVPQIIRLILVSASCGGCCQFWTVRFYYNYVRFCPQKKLTTYDLPIVCSDTFHRLRRILEKATTLRFRFIQLALVHAALHCCQVLPNGTTNIQQAKRPLKHSTTAPKVLQSSFTLLTFTNISATSVNRAPPPN